MHVQHMDNLNFLESLTELLEETYENGLPLHRANNDINTSAFKLYTKFEFKSLDHSVVQDILRQQHIIVTGQPESEVGFEKALLDFAPLHRVIQYQGQIS
jgi:hypothetical protein